MDQKIPQKRWMRIIPPVMLVYIFAFMDRMNFGFTMAGGMNEALKITASTAGLAAGVFSSVISSCRFQADTLLRRTTPRSSLL